LVQDVVIFWLNFTWNDDSLQHIELGIFDSPSVYLGELDAGPLGFLQVDSVDRYDPAKDAVFVIESIVMRPDLDWVAGGWQKGAGEWSSFAGQVVSEEVETVQEWLKARMFSFVFSVVLFFAAVETLARHAIRRHFFALWHLLASFIATMLILESPVAGRQLRWSCAR
jgi:hypothetical protein